MDRKTYTKERETLERFTLILSPRIIRGERKQRGGGNKEEGKERK